MTNEELRLGQCYFANGEIMLLTKLPNPPEKTTATLWCPGGYYWASAENMHLATLGDLEGRITANREAGRPESEVAHLIKWAEQMREAYQLPQVKLYHLCGQAYDRTDEGLTMQEIDFTGDLETVRKEVIRLFALTEPTNANWKPSLSAKLFIRSQDKSEYARWYMGLGHPLYWEDPLMQGRHRLINTAMLAYTSK